MEKASLIVSGVRPVGLSSQAVNSLEDSIRSGLKGTSCCVRYLDDSPDEHQKLTELSEIRMEQTYADRLKEQREKIELLRLEFDRKGEELLASQTDVARLRQENGELHQFKANYQCLLTEFERQGYELRQMKEERDYYLAKFNGLMGEGLQQSLLRLKEELLGVRFDLEKGNTQREALQRTVGQLKLEKNDLEQQFNYSLKQFKLKLAGLQAENDKLQKDRKQLRAKLQQYEGQRDGVSKLREQLEKAISELKEQNSHLKEEIQCKEEVNLALKQRINDLEVAHHRQYVALSSEVERRTGQLQRKDAQNHDLRLKLEERSLQLKAALTDIDSEKQKFEDLTRAYKKLAVELEALKNSRQSEPLSQLRKELEAKEKQLACLSEWKLQDRQVRNDLCTLRFQARQQKNSEIDRIDELINEIGVKHLRKRFC